VANVKRGSVLVLALVVLYLSATAARVYARQYYIFLPDYIRTSLQPSSARDDRTSSAPTHIFFLFVDHFEPDWSVERTTQWAQRYRALARRHLDSSGRPAQHTWFYPGDQIDDGVLGVLQSLMRDGLGEVEFHFHHDGDTAETLALSWKYAIPEMQKFGFMKTVDGRTAFAFIHGNESLDDSSGEYCGVRDELRLLHDFGCFADFTFPALFNAAQPPTVNSIYAARDDASPKSYRIQWPLLDLKSGGADLMIFQGPIVLAPTWNMRRLFIDVDDANIHPAMPANPARVRRWVNARIHVPQRPDWIFVKVFAHGASSAEDMDEVLGDHFDSALTELERHYNDGEQYVLHYVTAREAYNLAMAAASGVTGDPTMYFDREIKPYVASAARRVSPD